jgi:hypothetical protein
MEGQARGYVVRSLYLTTEGIFDVSSALVKIGAQQNMWAAEMQVSLLTPSMFHGR